MLRRRVLAALGLVAIALTLGCGSMAVSSETRNDHREAVYHPAPVDLETLR